MSFPQTRPYPEQSSTFAVVPSPTGAFGEQDGRYFTKLELLSSISCHTDELSPPSSKRRRNDSTGLTLDNFDFLISPGPESVGSSASTTSTVESGFDAFCPTADNFDFASLCKGPNSMQEQPPSTTQSSAARPRLQELVRAKDGTEYKLIVMHHPEEYYRARYGSEGVRAPLKALNENHHPTVKVEISGCKQTYGQVEVKLVHEDGSEHVSCSLDDSEERRNALTKKIGQHCSMKAEFEDLRIRREKRPPRGETGRKQSQKTAAKLEGQDDKKACLLFTAKLEHSNGEHIELQTISTPISLTAPPDPAFLEWLMPQKGHYCGGEDIVIKGSKMTAPKVIFKVLMPDNRMQDFTANVDKEKSHQNVLVAKTPSILQHPMGHITASVYVYTGRNNMESNPLPFQYIPDEICSECLQVKPQMGHGHYGNAPINHSPPPTTTSCSPPSPPIPTTSGMFTKGPSYIPSQQSFQPMLNPLSHPITPPTTTAAESIIIPSQPLSCGVGVPGVVSPDHKPSVTIYYEAHQQQQRDNNSDVLTMLMEMQGSTGQGVTGNSASFPGTFSDSATKQEFSYLNTIPTGSPGSDSPCYSPVTPVSPGTESCWIEIDRILCTLINEGKLPQWLQTLCHQRDHRLLDAYTSAPNDSIFFQNLLALEQLPPYSTHL